MQRCQSRANVINEVQSLSQHNAIKCIGRNMIGVGEVGYDGRSRRFSRHMQYIASSNSVAAVSSRIRIISNFQYAVSDVGGATLQKRFNVVTVYRRAPIKSEDAADWSQSPEMAESHPSDGKRSLGAMPMEPNPIVNRSGQRASCD